MPQPYLKHAGSVTKKLNSLKSHFKKIRHTKQRAIDQFYHVTKIIFTGDIITTLSYRCECKVDPQSSDTRLWSITQPARSGL